ncbi:16998_t:CDS:2 [Gigaspora margarita]|uniref:16998_t:CDS:1 n=1 Tax=Gigaspora margarita TaxID=4874 RepID=A0ABN7W8A6_GIGMA|nr:16998_t:CDS:2 [Gigaspora margarita]
MNPKGNIKVLEEIRNMSHMAIQQEQAIQREQRKKKAKKVHSETADLVIEFTPDEVQAITNVKKNSRLSIEDPILEIKAKTDECEITTNVGTNEETCIEMEIKEPKREVLNSKKQQQELIELSIFDIEDPIPENNHLISEMPIDKPELSTVEKNN